ncbi:hypothetical protein HUJ04_012889 [Dendroctonus ponderosae]|nr:hypothetical protein HUJ04_012889 [Dendroctonus ponderosae]KAH1006929.1 hypothetical protein HUJ05_007614 [Dendroctonus ponderosae]
MQMDIIWAASGELNKSWKLKKKFDTRPSTNEARIRMWAHCFRIGAGINTNMALESMNNFCKKNHIWFFIKRKANITVETLLDKFNNLVDAKMWKRITNMNRPNANNYQERITTKTHKMMEKMNTNLIQEVYFGEFKVKSAHGIAAWKGGKIERSSPRASDPSTPAQQINHSLHLNAVKITSVYRKDNHD